MSIGIVSSKLEGGSGLSVRGVDNIGDLNLDDGGSLNITKITSGKDVVGTVYTVARIASGVETYQDRTDWVEGDSESRREYDD